MPSPAVNGGHVNSYESTPANLITVSYRSHGSNRSRKPERGNRRLALKNGDYSVWRHPEVAGWLRNGDARYRYRIGKVLARVNCVARHRVLNDIGIRWARLRKYIDNKVSWI